MKTRKLDIGIPEEIIVEAHKRYQAQDGTYAIMSLKYPEMVADKELFNQILYELFPEGFYD